MAYYHILGLCHLYNNNLIFKCPSRKKSLDVLECMEVFIIVYSSLSCRNSCSTNTQSAHYLSATDLYQ